MKDWKLTSKAWNLPIPESDLDKIIPSLNGLELSFRPLVEYLTMEEESSLIFRMTEDGK